MVYLFVIYLVQNLLTSLMSEDVEFYASGFLWHTMLNFFFFSVFHICACNIAGTEDI